MSLSLGTTTIGLYETAENWPTKRQMYIGCHTSLAVAMDMAKYFLGVLTDSVPFGVKALLEATKRANFKDINSRLSEGTLLHE
ncbi:hypothetical protein AAHA92_07294 [Salvia divinorum]|uniref:Uncharacterized protein n=1 Tax=Salvia divinorum TaxID=28513 RepID=A0ABD1I8G9_SALDI